MVVWSIVWMITILLISVAIVIYYIMRYDHFWPNEISTSHSHDDHASHG